MTAHLAELRDVCNSLLNLEAGIETTPSGRKPNAFRVKLMEMARLADDELQRLTPKIAAGPVTGGRQEGRRANGEQWNND